MAEEPSETKKGRGCPPGQGTVPALHGGTIGNPPFVATDEQRARVRELAQIFPPAGEHYIASLLGIARDTLRRHFADDLVIGRAELIEKVGSQMIARALKSDDDEAKGDFQAQRLVLTTRGGWSEKHEHTGKDGGPIEHRTKPDLSVLSDEELEDYGRLSAKLEGRDPDDVVGHDAA